MSKKTYTLIAFVALLITILSAYYVTNHKDD